jgi:hypothetical protein
MDLRNVGILHNTTRRHNPEDLDLNLHCHENLKSSRASNLIGRIIPAYWITLYVCRCANCWGRDRHAVLYFMRAMRRCYAEGGGDCYAKFSGGGNVVVVWSSL